MKTITYYSKIKLMETDNGDIIETLNHSDYAKQDALKALAGGKTQAAEMRDAHFIALNALPSTPGTRWEISEAIYWEFLEMLPPMTRKAGGFYCCEADHHTKTGVVRSAYYEVAGKYWHAYEETN